MRSSEAFQHLIWPSQSFYWALLDTSDFPRASFGRGPRARQLGYLFESVLPGLLIEQVHAVYRHLPGDGRILACGVPMAALETLPDDTATLTPQSLPPFLSESVDPASLNVLTGRFLPLSVTRLRRRWMAQAGMILATCVALLVWGLERRTMALREQLEDVVEARTTVFEQVLGPGFERSTASGQPPELRLAAAVRRLEQTRKTGHRMTELTDCSSILESVLAYWPAEVLAQTESVSITEAAVTVRAIVATMADAQGFASAFATLPGWRLKQPRSETRRDHVVVTLRLEAEKDRPHS